MQQQITQQTLKQEVEEHLEDCIFPVLARAHICAAIMGMSESTFRKGLMAEGTTWTRLYQFEILRRDRRYRNQGMSKEEITDLLGYGHVSDYVRGMKTARAAVR